MRRAILILPLLCLQFLWAIRIAKQGDGEIWLAPAENGEARLALVNRGERAIAIDVIFRELHFPTYVRVREAATKRDWGKVQGGFVQRVEPGATVLFQLRPE